MCQVQSTPIWQGVRLKIFGIPFISELLVIHLDFHRNLVAPCPPQYACAADMLSLSSACGWVKFLQRISTFPSMSLQSPSASLLAVLCFCPVQSWISSGWHVFLLSDTAKNPTTFLPNSILSKYVPSHYYPKRRICTIDFSGVNSLQTDTIDCFHIFTVFPTSKIYFIWSDLLLAPFLCESTTKPLERFPLPATGRPFLVDLTNSTLPSSVSFIRYLQI